MSQVLEAPPIIPRGLSVHCQVLAFLGDSGDMCQIEEQPRTAAGEDPGAHHPQDKGGT